MKWSVRQLVTHLFRRTDAWDTTIDPTIRMLRDQRRQALRETRRLRRERSDMADMLVEARRAYDDR